MKKKMIAVLTVLMLVCSFVFAELIECGTCHGAGEVDCYSCDGRGEKSCTTCWGAGEKLVANPNYQIGDGSSLTIRETCNKCGGSGYQGCRDCGNDGRVRCRSCNGEGYFYVED